MRKRCKRVKRNTGHILLEHQVQRMVLPLHVALAMLPAGLFTRQHADSMAKIINVVFVDSDGRDASAYQSAKDAGDVLCSMLSRVNEGKSWNTTVSEREKLMAAIVSMDRYIRRLTTDRFIVAATTVDKLNAEAKAKGYGFLDKAPVSK